MAHFAKLENNVVTSVIVVNNEVLMDNGVESEEKGKQFCSDLLGGEWIQTSYNAKFRKHFAGIGFTYSPELDIFIFPQCHEEAVLDDKGDWICSNIGHENFVEELNESITE